MARTDGRSLHGGVSQEDARRGITAWNLIIALVAVATCIFMIGTDMKMSADSLMPYVGPEMAWAMSIAFGNALQYIMMVHATDSKWASEQSDLVMVFIWVLLVLSYVFDAATNYDGFVIAAKAYRAAAEIPGELPAVGHAIAAVAGILLSFTEWFLLLSWGKLTSDWAMYRGARKKQQQPPKPPQGPPPQQRPQQQQNNQKPQQQNQQRPGQQPQKQGQQQQHRPQQPPPKKELVDEDLKARIRQMAQQTGQTISEVVETAAREIGDRDPEMIAALRTWAKQEPASKKPAQQEEDEEG